MALNFLDSYLSFSVSYIPTVPAVTGIGAPAYLVREEAAGDPAIVLSTNPTSISGGTAGATEIAALLASNDISAQAADDLTAMISQSPAAPTIYLAGYDVATETPDDALDLLVANDIDFGGVTCEERTDAALVAIGQWFATGGRAFLGAPFGQSDEATLLTSGKPAALEDFEVSSAILGYHDTDAEPLAAALCGKICALNMLESPDGGVALQQNVAGVALNSTTLTSAQLNFALANSVVSLLPRTSGAGATARDVRGTLTYGDVGASGVFTAIFAVKRLRAAVVAMLGAHAVSGRPLRANADGRGEVKDRLTQALAPMADVRHFTPGEMSDGRFLSRGFVVDVTSTGSVITAAVTILVGPEATAITLPVTVETV